jgi:cellulose synthase/poly-beta-1,6-N-acetylglucosamine synthase-like glycosyltransferase
MEVLEQFLGYFDTLFYLVPIGVIGIWRWSAWMVKRFLSIAWRDVPPSDRTRDWTVGVAITVKGEPPDTFEQVLECMRAERIDQVCIVFDAAETENIVRAEAFARRYRRDMDIRMETTDKKGKRTGLAQAIAMCHNVDIIMCMDSDTLLGPGVKESVKAAFSDPRVGGVAVMQRAYKPETWVQHLFDIQLVMRYSQDVPGQALGGRVTCLSGRCSAYLAEPLQKVAPGLLTEAWLGIKKTGGGDDKFLTTAIHDLGLHTIAVRNSQVYTRPEKRLKVYISQSLRWARNSWFSDFRALTRPWMLRSPILLFYTVDRMASSFTILFSAWFMVYWLVHKEWLAAFILLSWWFISRVIKAYPYFKATHRYYMVVPFVFMNLTVGLLKIHALVTLYEGSWLTRGATGSAQFRKRMLDQFSRLATAGLTGVMGALVFFVFSFQPEPEVRAVSLASLINPDAMNDAATTQAGSAVSIDVLANDTINGRGDSALLGIQVYDQVSVHGGVIRLEDDNTLVYSPPANFEGEDTFTYSLTSNTDQATVRVTVGAGSKFEVDDMLVKQVQTFIGR